jgi:hypothetical protein
VEQALVLIARAEVEELPFAQLNLIAEAGFMLGLVEQWVPQQAPIHEPLRSIDELAALRRRIAKVLVRIRASTLTDADDVDGVESGIRLAPHSDVRGLRPVKLRRSAAG